MMFVGNCKSDEEDIYIKVSDAVQLLRDLPSVHAEPCSDAISRQAAENLFRNARAKLDASKYKTMAEFNLRDSMLLNAEQMIHLLPSVHAEPRTGQSKSIPSGLKLKIEREADYQNERVNADIARGMYLALEIIDKWEADHA